MLMPWKGLDILLRAVGQVASRSRKRLKVLIVGDEPFGTTDYLGRLKALVEELGIGSIAEFVGFVEDVSSIMIETDIAVHSAVDPEPFGRTNPEAMMCGAAVIATEGGGTSESVIHGETGLLVPRGDVDAMANALNLLIDNTELRTRLANRGREFALERFAVETIVQKVYEIYQELLENPRGVNTVS
jgi:glycosyltransferase involved in cell wall biosynthesis